MAASSTTDNGVGASYPSRIMCEPVTTSRQVGYTVELEEVSSSVPVTWALKQFDWAIRSEQPQIPPPYPLSQWRRWVFHLFCGCRMCFVLTGYAMRPVPFRWRERIGGFVFSRERGGDLAVVVQPRWQFVCRSVWQTRAALWRGLSLPVPGDRSANAAALSCPDC